MRDWPGLVRTAISPVASKYLNEGLIRADEASHIFY